MKRWLLGFAFRRKEAELRRGIVRRNSIWDRLIFRKVQVKTVENGNFLQLVNRTSEFLFFWCMGGLLVVLKKYFHK